MSDTHAKEPQRSGTTPDIEALRAEMKNWETTTVKALGPVPNDIEEFWTTITLPDGWQSKTKVVRPKPSGSSSENKARPLIVYFHGGGFARGTPEQLTTPARAFAQKFNAVIVCPSYRLVPEYRWPVPMRDGWDILVRLSKHASTEFGATLDGVGGGFVVAGVSAGANIAGIAFGVQAFGVRGNEVEEVKHYEEPAKPLTGIFMAVPVLITEEIVPPEHKKLWTSRVENKDNFVLPTTAVHGFIGGLQVKDVRSAWFSPVNATEAYDRSIKQGGKTIDIHKAPRVYFQAGHHDSLRDDAIVFEKILSGYGLQTKIDVFPKDGHMAWLSFPFEGQSENPTVEEATVSGMGWLLGN